MPPSGNERSGAIDYPTEVLYTGHLLRSNPKMNQACVVFLYLMHSWELYRFWGTSKRHDEYIPLVVNFQFSTHPMSETWSSHCLALSRPTSTPPDDHSCSLVHRSKLPIPLVSNWPWYACRHEISRGIAFYATDFKRPGSVTHDSYRPVSSWPRPCLVVV